MERSFVMVKPDGVQRGLVNEVIGRLERKGLKLVALKLMRISPELAERHYEAHRGKPFFPGLVDFITSGPVVAMVWEGKKAVGIVRSLMGATDPSVAAPGTIRGDLASDIGNNVVHGSDSPESAEREIGLFFAPEEVLSYELSNNPWVYGG
ncbi:MAG: nucleoside-diphosphate kinase [Firmicutes bacterium]|nr:nucleoside-diphosphate kinase [Bacillota bacterium]